MILTMWMILKLFSLPKMNGSKKHGLAQSSVLQVHNTTTTCSSNESFKHKPSHNTFRGGRSQHHFAGSRTPSLPPYSQHSSWQPHKPYCQICHKSGHTTDMCWHRYDPSPSSSFNANITVYAPSVNFDPRHSFLVPHQLLRILYGIPTMEQHITSPIIQTSSPISRVIMAVQP